MINKRVLKKLVLLTVWCVIASGMMTLLVAANSNKAGHVCKDVVITLKGVGESFYIDKTEVSKALKKSAGGKLVNKAITGVNLARLEKDIKKDKWIANAELFFDSKDVLHAVITEKEPIARVFTTTGKSFYLDTAAMRLPLLQNMSVRVPVITNFPSVKKLSKKDSALLKDIQILTRFVGQHPFWSAQVAQIDIVEGKYFEIVPTIGSHIINIGTAENLEQKFHSLMVFYKKVLPKVGFEKYSYLNVQYSGQVVATHKGAISVVDSLQLKKNVEELLKRNMLQEEAENSKKVITLIEPQVSNNSRTSATETVKSGDVLINPNNEKTTKPSLLKTGNSNNIVDKKKPKAVMPKKGD